jgi:peptidyl-prolyl cis-trans isomerase C
MSEQRLNVDVLRASVFDPTIKATKNKTGHLSADVVSGTFGGTNYRETISTARAIRGIRAYLQSKTVGALINDEVPQYLNLGMEKISDICQWVALASYDEPLVIKSGYQETVGDERFSRKELSAETEPSTPAHGAHATARAVSTETQHYATWKTALTFAQTAYVLAIRTLLLQEAARNGIKWRSSSATAIQAETGEEVAIQMLIDADVPRIGPDETTCRGFYSRNSYQFRDRDSFEASHILLAANPSDKSARREAVGRAEMLISELVAAPDRFGLLARRWSDCDSKINGGHLGTMMQGQAPREVDMFLYGAGEGQVSPFPIESRLGVHVVRLEKRNIGNLPPFEQIWSKISMLLTEWGWCRNLAAYIRTLVGDPVIGDMRP